MAGITVNSAAAGNLSDAELERIREICPFGAIEITNGLPEITAGCKACGLCVKSGPNGMFETEDTEAEKKKRKTINKDEWRGAAVFAEQSEGRVHPVSLELIGKARELARTVNHPVYAVIIGSGVTEAARELLRYGVDEVFVYDHPGLKDFLIEPYTNCFEDFINAVKPSCILAGATPVGRSLSPRIAARFGTGLTADCTVLDIKPNSDLVQIRPAFGGNIMAQIVTQNNRPQIATVRYKVFDAPERKESFDGRLVVRDVPGLALAGRVKVLKTVKKERKLSISDAEVIIACGRGVKTQRDMTMIYRLAELLGAEVACTRPLIEAGWLDASKQIGLSGRTVKPKLIITLGISGAVQFKAGMQNADCIMSVNTDKSAPIFDICDYAVIGDIYEIVPELIQKLEGISRV